ncbi:hypothetical protein ColLi_00497 [Colletotrichum liriopes]|uniref:Uncharacterized protein n=1 Tax=Colletotrichum liriopes TaxID=708192 RepID=A0AA37GBJ8_9PEZI|nr:hypothetical protein ColLi_00497 [Colletotrichum liriopes]
MAFEKKCISIPPLQQSLRHASTTAHAKSASRPKLSPDSRQISAFAVSSRPGIPPDSGGNPLQTPHNSIYICPEPLVAALRIFGVSNTGRGNVGDGVRADGSAADSGCLGSVRL